MTTDEKIDEAIRNPQNLGEMTGADAVGTAGSGDCGDMLRMWIKFREDEKGRRVIDKASFQSFGCQTAIAVASLATEMLKGKTVAEARDLNSADLSAPLGPLPPMKLHCGDMVEGALREALKADQGGPAAPTEPSPVTGETLLGSFQAKPLKSGKLKVVKLD